MEPLIDVPLFRQIATRIRHRIAGGELREGDDLPSLRRAAKEWGVNLHTVRRAYASLEEEGLVETRPRRGTRVVAGIHPDASRDTDDLHAFVQWVTRTGARRFGIRAADLAARIAAVDSGGEPVWVLECSRSLAADLARRIRAWSDGLDARPWLVSRAAETPPGRILATYYHYAEVRDALVGQDRSPSYFGVEIDRETLEDVRRRARCSGRLSLITAEAASGGALAEELEALLDGDEVAVDLHATRRPLEALADLPEGVPALLTPENWDAVGPETRASPDIFPLALRPDTGDLGEIFAAR